MSKKSTSILLKVAAALWLVWGLVHAIAGGLTITLDTSQAVAGIADAVDPATLDMAYPGAAGAIINQHGFNLLWAGYLLDSGDHYILWSQKSSFSEPPTRDL